ncbi:hypothetical protein EUGRSUZ_B03104 [Eucalyptus grandis]|uniref:Uncharacterized protein n=2 Tax=Eucalyptus grandis TaxID=71139 RepID=A0A059D7T1_EUCGR|nr:hypothetical protein EUGRSUZ_B03104 [Eucalyptus grandis]
MIITFLYGGWLYKLYTRCAGFLVLLSLLWFSIWNGTYDEASVHLSQCRRRLLVMVVSHYLSVFPLCSSQRFLNENRE